MADYRSPYQEQIDAANNPTNNMNSLADMFQKKQQIKQNQEFELQKQAKEHELKQQGAQQNLESLLTAYKTGQLPAGAGATLGADSAAITRPAATGMIDLRKEALDRKGQEAYSKRLEHVNGFSSALKDIENLTNRTGKGGVITNADETLQSTGTFKSAVPTSVLGLAEALGVSPKGGAEERKALERLQLEYQKSMTGARTSEDMSKREKQAMGWITSGDPNLVSKGIRALAHNVGRVTKTIQSGYTPEVQQRVHDQSGDPMELLSQVYQDSPLPAKGNSMMDTLLNRNQAVASPAPSQPQTIRVKHRQSGQTGTLPANEFDPNQYEKVQ